LQLGLYEQALDLFGRVNGPEGLIGQILSNTFLGREAIAGVLIERLNEQGASAVEAQLRSTLSSGFKPSVIGDSLLRAAQAQPSALAYQRAVRANPFDGRIISVAAMYMRQQKQVAPAYQVVVNALRFNQTSPLIWEQYALLSVEQGLLGQGEEGAAKVRLLASPADYQSFVSRYQPLRALIEKQREEFR
jgi:tetratricopeptide (TPR) repeat protein